MSKLPIMLFIAAALIASTVALTMPAANALIKRDYSYLNDNHCTARYTCAGAQICGDHPCAPGEYDKLQAALTAAQLGHQGGRSATQAAAAPTTPTAPSTTMPTGATPNVCNSVKNLLASAGVSSSATAKVMADLGCS